MADKKELEQLFNLKASFPTEDEQRLFFRAARDNDVKTLGKIIEKWPEAPAKWESAGDPVIMDCLRQADAATLSFLVEKGADVNQYDKSKFWNPLSLAAHGGYAAAVQEMLRLGADVNAKNQYGQTALYWAARENKLECVDLLVLCGANPADGAEAASKNENVREAIRSASERREKFLAAQAQQASTPQNSAPASSAAEAGEDDAAIRILKRIELKKHGIDLAPEQAAHPPQKKSWVKRIIGR